MGSAVTSSFCKWPPTTRPGRGGAGELALPDLSSLKKIQKKNSRKRIGVLFSFLICELIGQSLWGAEPRLFRCRRRLDPTRKFRLRVTRGVTASRFAHPQILANSFLTVRYEPPHSPKQKLIGSCQIAKSIETNLNATNFVRRTFTTNEFSECLLAEVLNFAQTSIVRLA